MFMLARDLFLDARVAELADALDLGSSGYPWGFESPLSHHRLAVMFPHIECSQFATYLSIAE